MSAQEHIFIGADVDPEAVADQLSGTLGLTVTHGARGEIFLSRPAQEDQSAEVGGEVYPNEFADPAAEPDEESLLDGYGIVWDIGYTGRDRAVQLTEAETLFYELAEKAIWPMALVRGLDLLIAAWNPHSGLRRFPENTTPDNKDRALWAHYRQEP